MAYLWYIALYVLSVYFHEVDCKCVVALDCEGTGKCIGGSNGTDHWACINRVCECRSHDTTIFKYHSDAHSYDYARDICLRENSHLVKVDSVAKWDLLKQFMDAQNSLSDPWIGLKMDANLKPQHEYRFQDGEISHFFKWYSGEPNSQDRDYCIRLSRTSKLMRTSTCTDRHAFICEKVPEISCSLKPDCRFKCSTAPEYHCIDHKCSCAPLG